ncbi:MAG: GWxTD domain-containing protein [Calditrichaceae bacterium]
MRKLLFFLLIPMISWSQFQFIPVSADYSFFGSNDSTCYVEFYMSIYQGNLSFKYNDSTYHSNFMSTLEILKDGEVIRKVPHEYQNTIIDTLKYNKYNQLIDVFGLQLPFGKYTAKVIVTDLNSKLSGEYILEFSTTKSPESLYASDIEFAIDIQKDDGQTLFNKNGLKVVPNPRRVFDLLHPVLYFYVELHNLPYSEQAQSQYSFNYYITNSDGDTVKTVKPKTKDALAPSLVEVGGLNIMSLPGGSYFLNISATDLKNDININDRKKFFVYKPEENQPVITDAPIVEIDDIFAGLTKEELENEFKMAKYFASKNEIMVFENLSEELAMKKFLTQFWRIRDKEKMVSPGQSHREFIELAEFSTDQFSKFGRKGWRTDQGRVIIMYGHPDEIERHNNSIDGLPYEIWTYHDLEGGAIFVFVDLNGFGAYELIHSSYRKELNNPDWQRIINQTGSSSSNSNDPNKTMSR